MKRIATIALSTLVVGAAFAADGTNTWIPKAPDAAPAPAVTPAATPAAAEATPAAAPAAAAPQATSLASLQPLGPAVITPRFNDVMTAVLYADQVTTAQLLDLGRWVDKPDSNGLTPLMVAVLLRDEDMVRLLLERGANPNAQAPGGSGALELAQANGDGGIERLLLGAGAR